MVWHYVKAGSPTPAIAKTSQNAHSSQRSVPYIYIYICRKKRQKSLASMKCRWNGSTVVDATPGGRWGNQNNPMKRIATSTLKMPILSITAAFKENAWYRGSCLRDHRQLCVLVKYTDAPMDEVPRNNRAWKVGGTRARQGLRLKQQPINHRTLIFLLNLTVSF